MTCNHNCSTEHKCTHTQPQVVGEFKKVSLTEYQEANPSLPIEVAFSVYEGLKLPSRATGGSAGHDFYAPYGFSLMPGETVKIPTGIRVQIQDGWWLACVPRSSLGFKYKLQLDNTVGVIDSDYYYSDNEGHIFFKLTNNGDQTLSISKGSAFAQGIFLPYGVAKGNEDISTERNGGFGSTNRG